MSSTRAMHPPHLHNGPLSNGHGTSATSHSKSHVLAGVQDAYWSDDEAEDADCPLCLEEMDLSDINFKPCPCGYQICRFCWHHIKENLNGRCPACRREYTEESVEFKPISREDQKRLNQQKRLRDRERKELEQLKRSHLVNVRVVQRNLVYVIGLGSRFAKEELIPSLRSTEYFGKYGKISKIVLVKRTASPSQAPVVGLYITYHRREDAARAIAAVDGTASPGTDGEVMRASYGTTKYCMSFLRGVSCTSQGCLGLHEWGEDRDCFTKEDLTTLKHAMKDTESRPRHNNVSQVRKLDETDAPALPRTASWGQKGATTPVTAAAVPAHLPIPGLTSSRPPRSNGRARPPVNGKIVPNDPPPVSNARTRAAERRNAAQANAAAQASIAGASLSRPSTPGAASVPSRPSTSSGQSQTPQVSSVTSSPVPLPAEPAPSTSRVPTTPSKPRKDKITSSPEKPKKAPSTPAPAPVSVPTPASPIPAVARVQDIRSDSVPPLSPSSTAADSVESTQTPPPPPGIPLPSTQQAYQLSTQAQALIDDVLNRRHSVNSDPYTSPFPDFDRTLSSLGDGEFTFNFNIDPKLAAQESVAEFAPSSPVVLSGSFDPFAAPTTFVPPGISPRRPPSSTSFAHSPLSGIHDSSRGSFVSSPSSYAGSFNPFAETSSPALSSASRAQPSPFEDDPLKRGSRFGFAQRKDSTNSALGQQSATSSPLRFSDMLPSTPSYASSEVVSPQPQMQHDQSWQYQRQPDYGPPPGVQISMNGYENLQHQHQQQQQQQSPRNLFQNMNTSRGDVFGGYNGMGSDGALHLKEMLHLDRRQHEGIRPTDHLRQQQSFSNQGFIDPAIMSMRINPAYGDNAYGMSSPSIGNSPTTPYGGGPPGLGQMGPPPGMGPIDLGHFGHLHQGNGARSPSIASSNPTHASPSIADSSALSTSDFPALPAPSADSQSRRSQTPLLSSRVLPSKPSNNNPTPVKRNIPTPLPTKVQPVTPSKSQLAPTQSSKTPTQPTELESSGRSEDKTPAPRAPSSSVVPSESSEAPAPKLRPPTPTPTRKLVKKPIPPPLPALPLAIQEPLLSRKARKNKPATNLKAAKSQKDKEDQIKDDGVPIVQPVVLEVAVTDAPVSDDSTLSQASEGPTTVSDVFAELSHQVELELFSFFDHKSVSPITQFPLQYGALVHALSALSMNGGLGSNLPSGSIDSAVSSFQQLLETLTQTISDLLRLLPRTIWDDSSSFDGVLSDMLKTEDFVEDPSGTGDEVAALTLALEKRARWMEIQLAKLEELHRDINNAATRAVLTFNERGWDRAGFLPVDEGALDRFDALGRVEESGVMRDMTVMELEAAHDQALREEKVAKASVLRAMHGNIRSAIGAV